MEDLLALMALAGLKGFRRALTWDYLKNLIDLMGILLIFRGHLSQDFLCLALCLEACMKLLHLLLLL